MANPSGNGDFNVSTSKLCCLKLIRDTRHPTKQAVVRSWDFCSVEIEGSITMYSNRCVSIMLLREFLEHFWRAIFGSRCLRRFHVIIELLNNLRVNLRLGRVNVRVDAFRRLMSGCDEIPAGLDHVVFSHSRGFSTEA